MWKCRTWVHHFSGGSSGSCHFWKGQFVKPLEQIKCFLSQGCLRDLHILPPNSSRESDWNTWKIQGLIYTSKGFDWNLLNQYRFWGKWSQHTPSCLFCITTCTVNPGQHAWSSENWNIKGAGGLGKEISIQSSTKPVKVYHVCPLISPGMFSKVPKTQKHIPSVHWKNS